MSDTLTKILILSGNRPLAISFPTKPEEALTAEYLTSQEDVLAGSAHLCFS